ncbi:MAG: hypothetical protein CMB32_01445, partial [Euryarchaeota archaeon]|nr:hypothetical protein [Euryarchaeota archaeon]
MSRITFFIATVLCCIFSLNINSVSAQYTLSIESSAAAAVPGATTYRFYVNMTDATDQFSAVFGNNESPLSITVPDGAFSSSFNASWSAAGINPAFFPFFPDMADDTYATINLT